MNIIAIPGQGFVLNPDPIDFDGLKARTDFGFLWDVTHLRRLDRMTPAERFALKPGQIVVNPAEMREYAILGRDITHNIMPTEGLNYVLNSSVRGLSQLTSWYIGLFTGVYTPVLGDTAATFVASATEMLNYAESTRVAFTTVAASGGVLTNAAATATFTKNTNLETVIGGFISSASAKSAVTGTLLSAAKFATSKAMDVTDQLIVTATLTATSS